MSPLLKLDGESVSPQLKQDGVPVSAQDITETELVMLLYICRPSLLSLYSLKNFSNKREQPARIWRCIYKVYEDRRQC